MKTLVIANKSPFPIIDGGCFAMNVFLKNLQAITEIKQIDYFIFTSIGDNLARTFVFSPFFGMWITGILFTPIAILITYAAANDSNIFSLESWKNAFKRKKKV